MRKQLYMAAAVAALLLGGCDRTERFTVTGTVEGATDSLLYFYHNSLSGLQVLDSVKLSAEGKFTFRAARPEAPDFYVLRIDNQLIHLCADSTETITVRASYPGMATNYEVEGSTSSERIRELSLRHQQLQEEVYTVERNTSLIGKQMADSVQRLIDRYKEDLKADFIYVGPERPEAYFALLQVVHHLWWAPQTVFSRSDAGDIKAFGAVATCWDTYHPGALRTEHLHNTALKGMNERRRADARENQVIEADKVTVSGIIDLQLPDDQGQTRTLSELGGKVVLLDFNLFAAPTSAARILMLRELYAKYHTLGLEIYQVSPDEDMHLWRQATESLPWVCVHDDSGASLRYYNVTEVPELFLIDRNSMLQKRSSQMDDIEAEIRRLL